MCYIRTRNPTPYKPFAPLELSLCRATARPPGRPRPHAQLHTIGGNHPRPRPARRKPAAPPCQRTQAAQRARPYTLTGSTHQQLSVDCALFSVVHSISCFITVFAVIWFLAATYRLGAAASWAAQPPLLPASSGNTPEQPTYRLRQPPPAGS